MATKDVSIRIATAADLEPIRCFLNKFYFRDEPLSCALELLNEENPVCKDFEAFCFQDFGKGFDLVVESKGEIVGVCLNILLQRGVKQSEIKYDPDSKFEIIVKIMELGEKAIDLFAKNIEINKIMSSVIISIAPDYRKQGLCKRLLEITKDLAKKEKADMVIIDCSSAFTAAASRSCGFKEIFRLNYADFKKDGKILVRPAPPHYSFVINAIKI